MGARQGPGGRDDSPLVIKVGDKILFGRHPRTEISIDGQAVLVVREDQVLAVLA